MKRLHYPGTGQVSERLRAVNRAMLTSGVLTPMFVKDWETVSAAAVAAGKEAGQAVFLEFYLRAEDVDPIFEAAAAAKAHYADADTQVFTGVGSCSRPAGAAMAGAAGLDFVVAQQFSPSVNEVCKAHSMNYVPGVKTPTEITTARDAIQAWCPPEIGEVTPLKYFSGVGPDGKPANGMFLNEMKPFAPDSIGFIVAGGVLTVEPTTEKAGEVDESAMAWARCPKVIGFTASDLMTGDVKQKHLDAWRLVKEGRREQNPSASLYTHLAE